MRTLLIAVIVCAMVILTYALEFKQQEPTRIVTLADENSTKGVWKKKVLWKARWVKEWKQEKVWKAMWKKVWGPVEIHEWFPISKPPQIWKDSDGSLNGV
ncbi:uncharacterized protein LOC134530466 [Bacillus rossius redtenbacheri]|uniref:uncharacterized protein LOC134530466 n=1 Tax=Bacillus rossius redtenbacheri TaxID=93214 RepID=UPI002FDCA740